MIKQLNLYLKINFKKEFQYKSALISGVITQLFFGFMFILMFQTFYQSGNAPDGFTISQLTTYIWLQQCTFLMFGAFDPYRELSQEITSGNLSYRMIKPINLYTQWFNEILSLKVAKTILRAVLLLLIIMFLPEGYAISAPTGIVNFLIFFVSLIFGSMIMVAFNIICYTFITITLNSYAVFVVVSSLVQLFAGGIIPVPLMPQWAQKALNFLPFRYMNDLPFRLYMGNIPIKEGLIQIAVQVLWIVALVATGKLFLNRRQNKLTIQGG